jgi:hypothetical protein
VDVERQQARCQNGVVEADHRDSPSMQADVLEVSADAQ